MSQKAVVLLSAGLDSTVNLFRAVKEYNVVLALTFNYGQKAASKEVSSAAKLAKYVGVPHLIVEIPWVKGFGQSTLLQEDEQVPQGSQVDIESQRQSEKTAKSVWVPNRNGIFLNIAAGYAESLGANLVIPGFNIEEASTFPDNTQAFLDSLTQSFSFSTANHVQATSFTTSLNKIEIVKMGHKLQVPWEHTWPCYLNKQKWCGLCESCLRAKRAFKEASVSAEKFFVE